jgi:hypothetical protein
MRCIRFSVTAGAAAHAGAVLRGVLPSTFVEADTDLTFVEFFQRARDRRAVGVVKIDLRTL